MEVLKLKKLIEKTLNQNKAKNIISINLKGKSSIADYMIVASGSSSRHIQSLSEIIVKKIQENSLGKYNIEGKSSADWKLIDAIDIIVHIFHPEKRKFYDLEKMWCDPTNSKEISL
tara:strand:+ start:1656 stop:2003 length:348 start_codon:yes stop_codon:yes gene_type:complete